MKVTQFKTVTKFCVVGPGCSGKMVLQKVFYDALNQELLDIANRKDCVEICEPEISIIVNDIKDMEAGGYSYEPNDFVGEKPIKPDVDSSIVAYTAIISYKVIIDHNMSDSGDGIGLKKVLTITN